MFFIFKSFLQKLGNNALHKPPILQDDSFYSRDMAKNDKNSVYNIRKKKDE